MKTLRAYLLLLLLGLSCYAQSSIRVFAYPAIIYDDAKCSIYQDFQTDLTFAFFYDGERITDLRSSGTMFYIELPDELKLLEATIMNGWKNSDECYTTFPSELLQRDGRNYRRYQVNVPKAVVQPTLKKPLPGGMFGGTANNIIVLMVKPDRTLPAESKIHWETTGKYPSKGEFTVYPVKLPAEPLPRTRIEMFSHTHLPSLGYSDNAIQEQIRLFKHLNIATVDVQMPDGKNQGRRQLWQDAGFKFFGGNNLMHLFWSDTVDADEVGAAEERDYLVGLDGRRSKGVSPAAYHHRYFCPQAFITPGRYPYRKLLRLAKVNREMGAYRLDIDLEVPITIMCYCSECLDAFFKFAGIAPENTTGAELVLKYPGQWYRFRSEQTRKIYQIVKEVLPGVKVGPNTILHDNGRDLGDLKFGSCSFAEDPRLMKGTADYVMLDTLMGGIYDSFSVDAHYLAGSPPIYSIAGSSYCVGYSWCDMAFRRETANMTGDTYGYGQRREFHTLGMLHQAANGSVGIQSNFNEAVVALAFADAVKILAQVENFYLDGKRADNQAAVADLTRSASRWTLDKSRVRGGIWRHFYEIVNGKVQSRTHTLKGEYLTGLYNWDPFQTKTWHLSLKDIPSGNWYIYDVLSDTAIIQQGKECWTAEELSRGFALKIPKAGARILRFSRQKLTAGKREILPCTATDRPVYNQYAWRKGEQIDMQKFMQDNLKRPLNLIKQHGGK